LNRQMDNLALKRQYITRKVGVSLNLYFLRIAVLINSDYSYTRFSFFHVSTSQMVRLTHVISCEICIIRFEITLYGREKKNLDRLLVNL
jgi:hypothetical protein